MRLGVDARGTGRDDSDMLFESSSVLSSTSLSQPEGLPIFDKKVISEGVSLYVLYRAVTETVSTVYCMLLHYDLLLWVTWCDIILLYWLILLNH